MTPPDGFIIVALIVSATTGFFRGAFLEVGKIVAFIFAFILAGKFWVSISNAISNWLVNDPSRNLLAWLAVFFLSYAFIGIIASVSEKFIELKIPMVLNRALGLILGIVRGSLLLLIVVMCLEVLPATDQFHRKMLGDSALYPSLDMMKNWISNSHILKNYRVEKLHQPVFPNSENIIP